MNKKLDWGGIFSKVPEHTQEALERYFLYGIEPGSFLQAVLSNDLYSAVARADTWNRTAIADIVTWIAHNAPDGSWGHPDYYREWVNKGPAFVRFEKSRVWDILYKEHTEMKEQDW